MTSEQKKLLSLFKEIDEICNRHHIVYYMAGGTLIGVMRHKGFIPWDDDMDILMTRDNWHKFIEVTRYDIPENRVLECQELDRDYPNMFGRYTDTTSSAIHKNQILGDGIAGYVVDILVLDPIPDKEDSYLKYRDDLLLYSDLVNPSLNYSYRYNVNKARYKKYYRRMKKMGKDAILSEIENRIFSYKEENCPYYVMRWGGAPFLFDKDMYGESRFGDFEGVRCRIPDRTGDYLTWHYGDDWMHIPPHSEHESHNAIFSFTTDYKTIQKDYLQYINVGSVRKSIIYRKNYLLKNMDKLSEIKTNKVKILSYATKCDIEYKVRTCGYDILEALNNEEYGKLSKLFEKFFSEQLSREQIGREDYLGIFRYNNPVYCGITDNILYVATMVLIHTNRIAKADRLIQVRELTKEPMGKELYEVKQLIAEIRKAISWYDLKLFEESFTQTGMLFEKYPKNYNINVLYIGHLMDRGLYEKAASLINDGMILFPNDGVFLKYYGDLVYHKNKRQAYDIYEKAVNTTTNGCVHLEVKEKAISDKIYFIQEIEKNCDVDMAERLAKLVGDDVDYYVLKHKIRQKISHSDNDIVEQILEIQGALSTFDFDVKLFGLLHNLYCGIGESDQMANFRKKFLRTNAVSEYHELATELAEIPDIEKDGTYYKLLGDVYSNLGLVDEANQHWNHAMTLQCSKLTEYELGMNLSKETF